MKFIAWFRNRNAVSEQSVTPSVKPQLTMRACIEQDIHNAMVASVCNHAGCDPELCTAHRTLEHTYVIGRSKPVDRVVNPSTLRGDFEQGSEAFQRLYRLIKRASFPGARVTLIEKDPEVHLPALRITLTA